MHSLTNLYPVLRHYGIHLKYIFTKTSSWEKDMNKIFPECIFTNDINDILNDNEVEGIFVSASSDSHYKLLSLIIEKGKKVFVEKPPCESFSQLTELITINKHAVCKVGLQRRYWPANKIILSRVKKTKTYNYRFHTGTYIEGDELTGLFIHPLDYVLFLFGAPEILSSSVKRDASGVTIHLHLLHPNGISGLIECSTHFSWNSPVEELQINGSNELLNIQYPVLVEGESKPSRIANMPAERIFNQNVVRHQYFSAKNFLLPVAELNTIYLQGFYHELETFINIVEGNNKISVQNDLMGLVNLYNLFEKIRQDKNY